MTMTMRAFRFPLVLTAALVSAAAAVGGQEPQPAAPKVEIKDVADRGGRQFATVRVNDSPASLHNARAKDIIETLAPAVPIVGLEHLPADRRFEVSALMFAKNDDEVLAKLGEKLGLSITQAETTAEFLIVRNLRNPVPPSWTPARPPAPGVTNPHGIGEVDRADHLYNAYDVSMIDFTHFLSDHTTKPVWNQTSLTGTYSFSFGLPPEANVMNVLFTMGFDAFHAKRTTRCVVIAPGASKQ